MIGRQLQNSVFLQQVFGYDSTQEMVQEKYQFPGLALAESESATQMQTFIEQIRYERPDGAPMSVRVLILDQHGNDVRREIWVEDTLDTNAEFSYQEFLGMLHNRIRAKNVE